MYSLYALRRCLPCRSSTARALLFSKSKHFDKAQQYSLFDCIECGCCSYVCPSHIPLVNYYRYAKSEISTLKSAERAANLARERFESRTARLERDQRERAERLAQKSAIKPTPDTDAAATIQAALARTQAQADEPKV